MVNRFKKEDVVVCTTTPVKRKTNIKKHYVYTVADAKIFNKSSGIALKEISDTFFFDERYFTAFEDATASSEEITAFVNSIF